MDQSDDNIDDDLRREKVEQPAPFFVKRSTHKNGKRCWDKRHFCIYCTKPFAQLPKHWQRKHKTEPEIKKAMSYKKGSEARKLIFLKLRNRGDYLHNFKTYREKKGMIVTVKGTKNPSDPENYLPCRYCSGTYARQHLFRHMKKCPLKPREAESKGRIQSSCSVLVPPVRASNEGFIYNILNNMKDDQVSAAVRRDYLAMDFGCSEYDRVSHSPDQFRDVSCKMREVGRLLLKLKENVPEKHLSDFIDPDEFYNVLEATRALTDWDNRKGEFGKPSLALKIGIHLKKLANIKIRNAIISKDEEAVKAAENFIKLRENEWTVQISTHALRTLNRKKWNKPEILPVVEDLLCLNKYLKAKSHTCQQRLEEDPTDRATWYELSHVLLAQIILFNRRRSGETARIHLEHYLNRSQSPLHTDVAESLSKFELALCDKLLLFEVEGKRGRKVPVILTPDVKKGVDLIVKTRNSVGVYNENPHLFARPYFNARSSIRAKLGEFATECGAKYPQYITSTRLRKHVATISQILNLTENELELLCSFMGHDIKVHRKFYRLPEGTLQVAKLGRILVAMERGETHLYKGKKLDEIDFDGKEVLDEETEVQEDLIELGNGDTDLTQHDEIADKNTQVPTQQNNKQPLSKTKELGETVQSQDKPAGPSKRRCLARLVWTEQERMAVFRHLKSYVDTLKVPGKISCQTCKDEEPRALERRSWTDIKFFVKNQITAKKRSANIHE